MDGTNLIAAIRRLQRRKPFDPFRIVTQDGSKYLVADPHCCAVTATRIFGYFGASDRNVFIEQKDVTGLEEFQPVASL